MMWQPFFAGAGFDPFMNGAWSWYPGFGYTFISAYPWGWMPYRYGNWAMVPGFGWMWQPGYTNGWATVPRSVGAVGAVAGFHALVAPTGTVNTVVVGKGGPVLSPVAPSRVIVSQGSAGMGVPRGSLEDLKGLNRQVAKSGFAEIQSTERSGVNSGFGSRLSANERGDASYSVPSRGSMISAAPANSAGSGHATGGSGHH